MPKSKIFELLGLSDQDVQNKINQFNFGDSKLKLTFNIDMAAIEIAEALIKQSNDKNVDEYTLKDVVADTFVADEDVDLVMSHVDVTRARDVDLDTVDWVKEFNEITAKYFNTGAKWGFIHPSIVFHNKKGYISNFEEKYDGSEGNFLVQEYLKEGNLLRYLRMIKPMKDEQDVIGVSFSKKLEWCVQIARGMNHLELLTIVHRDLAARNILLDKFFTAKVADFGMVLVVDEVEIGKSTDYEQNKPQMKAVYNWSKLKFLKADGENKATSKPLSNWFGSGKTAVLMPYRNPGTGKSSIFFISAGHSRKLPETIDFKKFNLCFGNPIGDVDGKEATYSYNIEELRGSISYNGKRRIYPGNKKLENKEYPEQQHWTALHYATMTGYYNVVSLLLSKLDTNYRAELIGQLFGNSEYQTNHPGKNHDVAIQGVQFSKIKSAIEEWQHDNFPTWLPVPVARDNVTEAFKTNDNKAKNEDNEKLESNGKERQKVYCIIDDFIKNDNDTVNAIMFNEKVEEELGDLFDKWRDSFNSEKDVNVIEQALQVIKFETHVMDLMWDVEMLGGGTEGEMSQADITKGWENGTNSPISALQQLTLILSWDANYRADHKDKLFQTVEDLCKHVMEGKIDENLYTEENLILLNDIFDMCCMENDSSDITDVMQYISDYWYQMVRKIDLAERKTLADEKDDFNEGPQAKRPRKMRTDSDN